MTRKTTDILAEAKRHLAYWKERLGLQPWNITVDIRYAIESHEGEAEVDVVWEAEIARISILHPDSYRARGMLGGQDIERAIVHELLHLVLDPIEPPDRKGLQWRVFEQVLDRIARALVDARHG